MEKKSSILSSASAAPGGLGVVAVWGDSPEKTESSEGVTWQEGVSGRGGWLGNALVETSPNLLIVTWRSCLSWSGLCSTGAVHGALSSCSFGLWGEDWGSSGLGVWGGVVPLSLAESSADASSLELWTWSLSSEEASPVLL